MSESPFANGVQVAWDATSISYAQTCLRKYQYRVIEGWKPRTESAHLRFGGHFATALEHFYKHLAEGLSRDDALRRVVREALEATWDRTEEDPEGKPWDSQHAYKTRENLIRTIVWYTEHFADDPCEVIHLANGTPAVELSFAFEVQPDIIFTGHLDRLVTYSGDVYVMDQKTTGSTISRNYMEQFKPNTQMSMYTFGGQIVYNVPVRGVIIDAAQVAVGFNRFERGFTYRTPEELNEWLADALYWVARGQEAAASNRFPMNPASCGNYGGCEFRHVCSRSPAVRQQFLEGDFERGEPWNPLETR